MLKLGHNLGLSIDVGPDMTTKIFTENGQVLHRSTYSPLIPNKIASKDGSDVQELFMTRVYERLGVPSPMKRIGGHRTTLLAGSSIISIHETPFFTFSTDKLLFLSKFHFVLIFWYVCLLFISV